MGRLNCTQLDFGQAADGGAGVAKSCYRLDRRVRLNEIRPHDPTRERSRPLRHDPVGAARFSAAGYRKIRRAHQHIAAASAAASGLTKSPLAASPFREMRHVRYWHKQTRFAWPHTSFVSMTSECAIDGSRCRWRHKKEPQLTTHCGSSRFRPATKPGEVLHTRRLPANSYHFKRFCSVRLVRPLFSGPRPPWVTP